MKLIQLKRGVTLVELVVTMALLAVLLVGIGAIFLSTNRIYGIGTNRTLAKEYGENAVLKLESTLKNCKKLYLKTTSATGKNRVSASRGRLIVVRGGESAVFGSEDMAVNASFVKLSDNVINCRIEIVGTAGTLYRCERAIALITMSAFHEKVSVQDATAECYYNIEYE